MPVIEGRTWLEILSPPVCEQFLRQERVGRVALLVDSHPEIFPLNYAVSDEGAIVFRTDPGTKLDSLSDAITLAFEIDGVDAENRSGWSVLVVGDARRVTKPGELARLRELPLEPWAAGEKAHYIRLAPSKVTGRRIHHGIGVA